MRAVNKADSDYTVLSFGTESVRVKVSDMRYLEAAEHVITVHFKDGEPFKMRKSLSAPETELLPAPHYFIRVNNYTLVNPKYVTRTDGQEIWLGDDVLTVSRARRKLVMEKLTEYMGKR